MLNAVLSPWQNLGQQWRGSATLLASDQKGQVFAPTPDRYTIAERYYANAMYERADSREAVISSWFGLPRQLRPVLSLVKPATDWWPSTLFGGVWTADGLPASDGQPNLLTYDADTPDELRLAVQTAYAWANGGAEIPAWCRQCAMLGDAFGEIQVDLARQKAYPKFWHPKYVCDIEWNDSGDVVAYTIEVPMVDERGTAYRWGKTVTKDTVTTLYNGKPMGYDGNPAVMPNQWSFVPAVWVMFVNAGGQHGQNVIDGLMPVIDEVNGVVGAVDDFIHKFIKQHVLLETTDTAGAKRKLDEGATKRGPTSQMTDPNADRESMTVRPVPPGTAVHRLIENLGLGEADPHIARLLANIDRNLPELTIDEKIAASSQVTGPGGRVIVAPMQRRVNHAFGNIAAGLIKLGQMACSINGELIRTGAFGLRSQLTEDQQRFLPFSLASWPGDLRFGLVTPKLLSPTMAELAAEAKLVESLQLSWSFRHVGLSDADLYGQQANGEPNPAPIDVGLLGEKEASRAASVQLFNSGGAPFGGG